MTAPARFSTSGGADFGIDDTGYNPARQALHPGERIGRPHINARRRALRRGVLVASIALFGGWAVLGGEASWPGWLVTETLAVFGSMTSKAPSQAEPATTAKTAGLPLAAPPVASPPIAEPPALAPLPQALQPAATSAASVAPAAHERATEAPLSPAESPYTPSAGPLPTPTIDPADPYQARAAAVGLHPEISRVLLTRLSPADYRNAGVAIRTALAETADDAVLIWPRQRTATSRSSTSASSPAPLATAGVTSSP